MPQVSKTIKIGLSVTDKQNMSQEVYERLLALTFQEYSTSETYREGVFVVYNDQLYKCISATGGDWDSSKWQLATLNDLLEDVEGAVVSVNGKANVDGNYPTMTVGNADQLNSTVYVVDKSPYLYRTSGGDADIGNREYDKIIGGSLVVNQYAEELNSSNWVVSSGNSSYSDDIATFTVSAVNAIFSQPTQLPLIVGHKYLMICDIKTTAEANKILLEIGYSQNYRFGNVQSSDWQRLCGVIQYGVSGANNQLMIRDTRSSDWDAVQVKNVMFIDLTQMFGSTIADYIYSLEQANTGAGVAWFKNYFQELYYPYNTGAIKNVKLVSHDMVGFNQWDEEWELGNIPSTTGIKEQGTRVTSKNYIKVLPNTTYYFKFPLFTTSASWRLAVYQYRKDYSYIKTQTNFLSNNVTITTSEECYYILILLNNDYGSTYNHDICINLSWSGWRNGQYEAYKKNSYPLDTTIELRGIPKLDSNNQLYFDGDEYSSDGKVVRKYGIVDLGTLSWSYGEQSGNYRFVSGDISSLFKRPTGVAVGNGICSLYTIVNTYIASHGEQDKTIALDVNGNLYVVNNSYTDAITFKTAMSGVYLVYELATPTEETAATFQEPQIVDDFGTEEYVVPTQDGWQIPVGHDTKYPANLRDKLQRLPDMPSVSQNVTETYVVNYNGTTKKCTFVGIDAWLSSNGYKKTSELPTIEALGGTLRQCLCIKGSLDFDNTDVVDMGTLNWNYSSGDNVFYAGVSFIKADTSNLMCSKYKALTYGTTIQDKTLKMVSGGVLYLRDTSLGTDATDFKNVMKGVLLAYEKA